jgi:hypothetical protein
MHAPTAPNNGYRLRSYGPRGLCAVFGLRDRSSRDGATVTAGVARHWFDKYLNIFASEHDLLVERESLNDIALMAVLVPPKMKILMRCGVA